MRVVVTRVPGQARPAHRALRAEMIAHDELTVTTDSDPADGLADIWKDGHGFIVVEHDVVPWPGALHAMWACARDWCFHRYPKAGRLTRGIGCVKFSNRLVNANPDLWRSWAGRSWQGIDGDIGMAVGKLTGKHEHNPPVAHARR